MSVSSSSGASAPVCFETHPSRYRHMKLSVDGPVATLALDIAEDGGMRTDYALKLNSYDLSVDIELADAVSRLRFEHPEVSVVRVTSAQDGVFSAGANIFMLGTSTHAFKVNFCKMTNETRLAIEDASQNSGQTYVAALNGVCSGGGYELAMACEHIYLVDDRRSAVSLPEVPYLGVLPGTGGLTRLVDKRGIRRDRADAFCTLAEGLKGKRAKAWGLVDDVFPSSRFEAEVQKRVETLAGKGHPERQGVTLEPLEPKISDEAIVYRHVTLTLATDKPRVAKIEIRGPDELPEIPASATEGTQLPASWYPLRMFRELDDALLRLRLNHPGIGLVCVSTKGDADKVKKMDEQLVAGCEAGHWFVREVVLQMKRVLKRMDMTAKSFFTLIEPDSCFTGSLLELALAGDQVFMRDEEGVTVTLTDMNNGPLPMGNGLTRLATRLLANPEEAAAVATQREPMDAQDAEAAGLVTMALDDIDWDDDVRVAIEERASLSPDALTGLEANLRFAGPETLETKIFGRLTAWQNWIFQRPNAVGPKGALSLYGRPESPEFNWERT